MPATVPKAPGAPGEPPESPGQTATDAQPAVADGFGMLTREELLGGLPARRASTLLFARATMEFPNATAGDLRQWGVPLNETGSQ